MAGLQKWQVRQRTADQDAQQSQDKFGGMKMRMKRRKERYVLARLQVYMYEATNCKHAQTNSSQ